MSVRLKKSFLLILVLLLVVCVGKSSAEVESSDCEVDWSKYSMDRVVDYLSKERFDPDAGDYGIRLKHFPVSDKFTESVELFFDSGHAYRVQWHVDETTAEYRYFRLEMPDEAIAELAATIRENIISLSESEVKAANAPGPWSLFSVKADDCYFKGGFSQSLFPVEFSRVDAWFQQYFPNLGEGTGVPVTGGEAEQFTTQMRRAHNRGSNCVKKDFSDYNLREYRDYYPRKLREWLKSQPEYASAFKDDQTETKEENKD